MSSESMALGFIALGAIFLVLGVHVGLVLAITGALGLWAVTGSFGAVLGSLKTVPYHAVATYALVVLPLFVLMGEFSLQGGISTQAYRALYNWLGRLPGGLGIATTWACTAFGATSGSVIAAASVFTKISLPEMRKAGYDKRFSSGIIAAAAPIAMLIPPSLFFVFYGMLTEESIAKLLISGVFPGLILAIVLSLQIWIMAVRQSRLAPVSASQSSLREKLASVGAAWPTLVLAAIIVGGIYTGVFTPTEAASVGTFVAFLICFVTGTLNLAKLKTSLIDAAELSAMMSLIFIGASVFTRFMVVSGLSAWVASAIINLGLSSLQFVIALMVLFIILGCFLDGISIMAITIPVFFPVVVAMRIDPIWFGTLTVVALDIGTITPPFALVCYTIKAVAGLDLTLEDVFKGVLPFYYTMLVLLILLVAFPGISIFLPSLMGK